MFSLKNHGLVMLLRGNKNDVDLFIGVVSRNLDPKLDENREVSGFNVSAGLDTSGHVLKNSILSNFPGSVLVAVGKIDQNEKVAEEIKHESDKYSKKRIITESLKSAGWNLVKSENKYGDIFPNFTDVAIEVEKYINKSEYSEETEDESMEMQALPEYE